MIAPNGPHSTTTPSTSTCPLLDRGVATKTEPRKKKPIFIELFAGTALLSKAVERVGVEVATPEDISSGGVDFTDAQAVRTLWERWQSLVGEGYELYFHMAPPCSSFSRARDRSRATRLRSLANPEGLYPGELKTMTGNQIAQQTLASLKYLVGELAARGTVEQPAGSYLMPYWEKLGLDGLEFETKLLHQCRYGRPYKKPTCFFVFGDFKIDTLSKTCGGKVWLLVGGPRTWNLGLDIIPHSVPQSTPVGWSQHMLQDSRSSCWTSLSRRTIREIG